MDSQSKAFFGISALLFAACTAGTVAWSASMSGTGGMPMPGGWTMSMTWMRMPGQGWLGAAISFLAMWVIMMAAMMLPSLAPTLWRFRQAVGAADAASHAHLGRLAALAGAGYFFAWAVFGLFAFLLGVTLAGALMRSPALASAVPIAVGAVVLPPVRCSSLRGRRVNSSVAARHRRAAVGSSPTPATPGDMEPDLACDAFAAVSD